MASISTINGIAAANVASVNGIAVANIASINGVDWPAGGGGTSIPEGLIIPFTDGGSGAPSGWSLYSTANGYYIIGAGDTYAVDDHGAGTGTHQCAIAANVNHLGNTTIPTGTGTGGYTTSKGSHAHTTNAFTYTPPFESCYLIKAGAGLSILPQKGVIFSPSGDPSGGSLANIWTDGYMFKANNAATIGGSDTIAGVGTSAAGTHDHGTADGSNGASYVAYEPTTAGGHSHSITITITNTLRRYALSAWRNAVADFDLAANMIGMYESLIPPDGWYLCNGSNGTPDLRNYFIRPITSGSEGASGDGTVTATSAAIGHGTHNHAYASGLPKGSGRSVYHLDNYAHPNHAGINSNYAWLPPYYALAFIMYGG